MRDSYFAHVYHTVAMEGNTLSLVQTRFPVSFVDNLYIIFV
jgi:hypothetical protein